MKREKRGNVSSDNLCTTPAHCSIIAEELNVNFFRGAYSGGLPKLENASVRSRGDYTLCTKHSCGFHELAKYTKCISMGVRLLNLHALFTSMFTLFRNCGFCHIEMRAAEIALENLSELSTKRELSLAALTNR